MNTKKLVAVSLCFALGAALYFLSRKPPAGSNKGSNPGAVARAGAGSGPTTEQEAVLPVEHAKDVSPLLEAHATWPAKLQEFPEKPSSDQSQAAFEVEKDVKDWFSKDLQWKRQVDGAQVYLRGATASGSVVVVVGRNRVPGKFTLGFEASYASADSVDDASTLKRLRVVLAPALMDEVEKRGIKPSPALKAADELAGVCMLDPAGAGTVFPYFYVYATPKTIVGVLQTIAMMKVK